MSVFLAVIRDDMYRILQAVIVVGAALSTPTISARVVQDAPVSLPELVAGLDDERTAWASTVRIREAGPAGLQVLLDSGATAAGPHDDWSPRMLAIAKFGESAIPPIAARLVKISGDRDQRAGQEMHALIKVLGAIGPAAIPTLIDLAGKDETLEQIVAMEPRTEIFGQDMGDWHVWRPEDDRVARIGQSIGPLLPRLVSAMEANPRAPRPAAYLLGRWGIGITRERGMTMLEGLSRASETIYENLETVELLRRMGAPSAAMLLRGIGPRVSSSGALSDSYVLRTAIALYKAGDPDYARYLDAVLKSANASVRADAIRFTRSTGNLAFVEALISMIENATETGRQWSEAFDGRTMSKRETIGDVALTSLRGLTWQAFEGDARIWTEWWREHRTSSESDLLSAWIGPRIARVKEVPIWEANQWIGELTATSDGRVLPLVEAYLARPDLDAYKSGPHTFSMSGGSGPVGLNGPRVVTLLLRLTQAGVSGSRELLMACLTVTDPSVRMYGALAISAFDKRAAVDNLARELGSSDAGVRWRASDFLLQLGDARGIASLIDRLEDPFEPTRRLACRDLRMYTQQALPCDPDPARGADRWRAWWSVHEQSFNVRITEAKLDEGAFPRVSPVSFRAGVTMANR
jgi:HEAT repeat protein